MQTKLTGNKLSYLLLLFFASWLHAQSHTFSVNDYGAKGNGATLDTRAIQAAIDAAAQAGGGTVIFRPGTYLSGAIFVKSHVHLNVGDGVTILGVQDTTQYPMMPTRVAGIEMTWPAALINVYQQQDAAITGPGTIDGNGKYWWDAYWALRRQYEPKGLRWAADYDAKRPRLVQIFDSKNVSLKNIRLERSGFWTIHICYSSNVTVDGATIRNNIGGKGPSTDGIDIDSSRHVLVEHADIEVNDDALCLKAGRDWDGLRVHRPTEDIVIRDSIVRAGAAGFTIGSETSGGFRNVDVYRLTVLAPVPSGILFKSDRTRGGGAENIRIHDITMKGVAVPIHITMDWNPKYSYATIPAGVAHPPDYWKTITHPVRPPERGLPHFRHVKIWNIDATGAMKAFVVSAYPEAPLVDFDFSRISISAQSAGSIKDAKNWKWKEIKVQTQDGTTLTPPE
ncbi:MAG: glycosyl hydrolase family 28 protein [Bacillota bacterium]|jgi:polygalacturonase|nr:glycosyl hydrolase family 28 protein [Bacillota bacterium]